MVGWLCKV